MNAFNLNLEFYLNCSFELAFLLVLKSRSFAVFRVDASILYVVFDSFGLNLGKTLSSYSASQIPFAARATSIKTHLGRTLIWKINKAVLVLAALLAGNTHKICAVHLKNCSYYAFKNERIF